MIRRRDLLSATLATVAARARAQTIEFESGGLRYLTQTRNGVTVMFAHLPLQVREFAVIQVAISNGASISWNFKPEDFTFQRPGAAAIPGVPARVVVDDFLRHGGRDDVVKLVTAYEAGLYGMPEQKSTNGYESRRQSVIAEVAAPRFKAAAAASAIVLVPIKLKSGESTDGAVFFNTAGKALTAGKLTVNAAGSTFEFESAAK